MEWSRTAGWAWAGAKRGVGWAVSIGIDRGKAAKGMELARRQEILIGRPVEPGPEWIALTRVKAREPELFGEWGIEPLAAAPIGGITVVGKIGVMTPAARNLFIEDAMDRILREMEEINKKLG